VLHRGAAEPRALLVLSRLGEESVTDSSASREGLSRRQVLALGALAVPAGLVLRDRAAAQDFVQIPLPPEAARTDPFHEFWERIPREFPLSDDVRYFNTAGLGIPPFEVLQRVQEVALEVATSGELHRSEHLETARSALARLLHVEPDTIALTRNATEGMNLVARGLDLAPGDEVLMTTHEHPGGAAPWVALAKDVGIQLRLYDPTGDPRRDAEALWKQASVRTRVVMVSHVLSTTGAVMPVAEIASEARRRGLWCVIDGAQAAGILPLDLAGLGVDAYVASGHKWLLGPVETGFLYIRRERLPELHTRFAGAYAADAAGWSLEESRIEFLGTASRFEYGTRSPSQAAGLAAAIGWQEAVGIDLIRARATALASRFRTAIDGLPGIEVLTPASAVDVAPIVTFRVTRRPNTQVFDWLRQELGMRVRIVSECRLNAVRASFHLVDRRPDVDWMVEGVRALGA
jgi:cysteine desulfurase / selenocysteine lyase